MAVVDELAVEPFWKRIETVLISDAGAAKGAGLRARLGPLLEGPVRHGSCWSMTAEIAGYQLRDGLPVPVPVSRALAGIQCRLSPLAEAEQCAVMNWGYAVADAAMLALGVPEARPPLALPRVRPRRPRRGGRPDPGRLPPGSVASGFTRRRIFAAPGACSSYNGVMILGRPDTIIVVAPELTDFYAFVKPRQEAEYGSLVVLLDRRQHERRQAGAGLEPDRRRADRREQSEPAKAQLAVLGFTVLHRVGEQYSA